MGRDALRELEYDKQEAAKRKEKREREAKAMAE
jgi:hypothetical protein